MKRIPDPLTYNDTYYSIMRAHTVRYYNTKEIKECPEDVLVEYDYNISNMKVEGKLRHYAYNMTDRLLYSEEDILVEKQQHKGIDDGWFYECKADRIFYIKLLYHNICPVENEVFVASTENIKKFTFIDCSWPKLKQLIENNNYDLKYSGKTTGSLNWVVPLKDLDPEDYHIWRHTL